METMRISPVLALAALGCGLFDSAPKLEHAVATRLCGPVDQPVTSIMLARDPIASPFQPPFPHVSVVIMESVGNLAGRTWDITTDMGPGAWYVTGGGANQRQAALSGHVRVTSVDSAQRIRGAVELRFPARTVVTDFSAPWVEPFFLCG